MIPADSPVIFVDDDSDDHFIFREICKNLGIKSELLFFDSGYDLLRFLKETDVDPFIIFCDINMPQISGLELRKEINKDITLKEKSIPFVFFSTAASPDQIRKAYEFTVQGFFLKEATLSETEETIRTILAYWRRCKHPNSLL